MTEDEYTLVSNQMIVRSARKILTELKAYPDGDIDPGKKTEIMEQLWAWEKQLFGRIEATYGK